MDEKDGQKDRVSRTGQSAHRSRTTRHNRERANDARLAWSALDAVQVSVYGVTPEGSFFYVNDSACASLGYTRDELLRMTFADVDPDCPASARQAHWDRLKKHRTLNFESRHRRKDGTTFPVEIADSYVQYEGRELEFALARDLTMQERAQQALKNSEEKYRSLFEQSREAIALVDPTGRTLEVNQAWLDLSGYSRDELSGFNAAEGWANPEERKDFLRRVAATGYVEDEVRFKKKDGTVMDCDLSVVEWKDEHGNTVAYQTLVLDITERKNAEEKLRSGEERYRELFEHSRDAITLVAPDGRILDVNPAWLNLHGYSRDELPGLNAVDIYANPEDREDFLRRIAGAGFVEGEVRLKKKDGTVMDCHMVLVARKDDEGNVVAYQGLVRDITEQKRAQQALKDREEKFRSLFEQSMDAILISTPDGSSMDANHAWLDLFGYSRDELPGLNEVDMYANPQDRDDFVRRIAPTGVLIDNEVRLKKKDGTVMDCQRSVVARKDEQGNIVAYQGVIHDITEQKRAQEELRSSEERYRLVADNTLDVIWSMGLDLVFTYVNPAIYQMLGYAPEEWVGSSLADHCSGEHLQQMKDIIGHEIANPHAHTGVLFETVMRHKNGDSLPVEIHGKVVVDGNGRPVGLQGTTIDIAERRLTEEALRQSEERYRVMFENSGTAMVIVEEDTTISLVNHQFETLSGYSRQEIEGKKRWTEFIVAGDVERMRRHHRARRAGEPAPEEYMFRLVDRHGNARDMYINVGLIPGTVRSIASLRDITEERKAQDRLQESFIDLVEVMTRSMESLDPYTSGHQRRVARLADLVGRELGMDDDRLQGLYIGALLHDIGKLGVPSTILTKPGRLSEQEWNIIRAHPRRGYDILKEANLPWPVAEMALRHHERLDGSGYPDGVKGTELSLEVRILGVCDVIEAMSSDRPYRAARPTQEVVQELRTGSGQRYDAQVVEAALKVVERGAFPLEVSGAYTGGNGRGEEKRLSHVEPVAGEGATLVERTAERGTGAPGSEPSGGNRLEEQPAEELLNLAETLSRAMASRDPTMTNHQRRVADFVVQVGTRLGLPAERLWGLRLGGLLHDVGKIAVPEFILTRPGRLSREELELVRTHPDAGYEILRDAGLPPVVPLLALHHHERLDGSGYPHGLTGDSLSMEDRILSVCNIVEAMGAHRPYRRGLGKKEVIAEIVTGRGTRYDPEVVDCVLGLLESGEFVLGE